MEQITEMIKKYGVFIAIGVVLYFAFKKRKTVKKYYQKAKNSYSNMRRKMKYKKYGRR